MTKTKFEAQRIAFTLLVRSLLETTINRTITQASTWATKKYLEFMGNWSLIGAVGWQMLTVVCGHEAVGARKKRPTLVKRTSSKDFCF